MNKTMLELGNISKSFDGMKVLGDISLSVADGEFVSIVGPSGSGKSTVLRLLTQALRPDSGTMLFNGVPLEQAPHSFAFMPQRDALMPWRRIIDNAALGLEVKGMSRRAARAIVAPLFESFGLAGFEHHYPSELSGGMRQRAALLRTVVQTQDMLLLDEPFGALDALTRTQIQEWLQGMWTEHRWTALLITHDVREAVFLSDRIYVLSARPARIIREFRVPLPRPRSIADLGSPAAQAIETEILQTLLHPLQQDDFRPAGLKSESCSNLKS
ncbi:MULTISPECIES: ABC transporter ATP-binding protein [Rhizobium]|uniref:ABC transporter ATP-binding protein n=1 Tax=Rhizobium TaxID=379 RepID=UPI00160FAA7B|nr:MULTISPECIES: ABC transporter ATP-binding protein [Rhizobium]MBB4298471.1 ABC-type nitrate/sulfonate/bicarbonate transport system ATPase subunit [Rhizobium leguminosarum]MBB4309609.1 ABC-type nitrate/sulfonate/bicarbonate transport system ATPase subunit [Rhizobium leguminosarum]MBB4419046.1 ABC-type nitrate/sulfonate/bicarbonate transport system ATPase subunit [Rhizobium leguminosarum]MBB4433623.1 ABC-type nitrate/sulfonate/bicarbonate transport system ATPase subunit [Rhizobium esperanzae]M